MEMLLSVALFVAHALLSLALTPLLSSDTRPAMKQLKYDEFGEAYYVDTDDKIDAAIPKIPTTKESKIMSSTERNRLWRARNPDKNRAAQSRYMKAYRSRRKAK